ncbi:MAG: phosphotransferase enzyme family protein [Acidimicrobiales bacterium]
MSHLVHGMGLEPVAPDWSPITAAELREPLAQLGQEPERERATSEVRVLWRSPRPMSAAALVRVNQASLFVKRHHEHVRTAARLEVEHRFGDHLRAHGVATPASRRGPRGESVARVGPYLYEVFDVARGRDLYRDVPSWYPYAKPEHARHAGAALARLHQAAATFDEPASSPAVLLDAVSLADADDPRAALVALLRARPGLARALEPFAPLEAVPQMLAEPLARARAATRALARQWTHGDWHPSNLTWDPARDEVREVLDLGLANRTFALHDLALAVERATIDWLDVAGLGAVSVDWACLDALLEGYDRVSPLRAADRRTLAATLPVAHVDFALSEVEYFGDVLGDTATRDLAYHGYLLGHVTFFDSPLGLELLERVASG